MMNNEARNISASIFTHILFLLDLISSNFHLQTKERKNADFWKNGYTGSKAKLFIWEFTRILENGEFISLNKDSFADKFHTDKCNNQ